MTPPLVVVVAGPNGAGKSTTQLRDCRARLIAGGILDGNPSIDDPDAWTHLMETAG